jgi:Terminase small subunit
VPSLRPTTLLIPPPTWSPSRHSAPHRWEADPALAAQVEETLSTLTLKRQRFLRSYFQSGNAAQAVREAGYRVKDARSAADVGHEILASPTVQHAFQALREARGLSAEKLDQIHAAHLARHSSPDGGDRDRSLRALALAHKYLVPRPAPGSKPPSTSSSTR